MICSFVKVPFRECGDIVDLASNHSKLYDYFYNGIDANIHACQHNSFWMILTTFGCGIELVITSKPTAIVSWIMTRPKVVQIVRIDFQNNFQNIC